VTAEYSDEEFVGYTFGGSPPRRPRLWFLDRHIALLLVGAWPSSGTNPGPVDASLDVGTWTPTSDVQTAKTVLPGLCLRYRHLGDPPWSAVWRMTALTIPRDPREALRGFGITTFGRDDDVWRLGVWPD
jgi:hypothetical protein